MERVSELQIREAVANFNFVGRLKSRRPFGSGHINDTYLLVFEIGDMGDVNVILQRMNREIFTKPVELMENIVGVTSYLREKIIENGGDPERETLNMIPAKDGKAYYVDSKGEYWRAYKFITDATSYDQVEKPEDFYESAVAFGHFQRLLADYPAETLHETIEGFHDTKARFQVFKEAVAKDVCGRAASVQKEIDFVLSHEDVANVFGDLLEKGEIPLRVTHNDTKISNILFDDKGDVLCVIDLDTCMSSTSLNDFGDAIRSYTNTGAEDDRNLDKVGISLEMFEAYTRGYLSQRKDNLTASEIGSLAFSARYITFEQVLRFLMDYIDGDKYYKTAYPGHNLVRTHAQYKLLLSMEENYDAMRKIVEKYAE